MLFFIINSAFFQGLALDQTAPESSGKTGLPQLDISTFEPQIAWLILIMVIFYVVVSKFVLPSVGNVMEIREERISSDIDKASMDRSQADLIRQTCETHLAASRADAQTLISNMKAKAASNLADKSKALDGKLALEAVEAEAIIFKAKSRALAEIEPVACTSASQIVVKLSGKEIENSVIQAAVEKALANKIGV